MNKIEEYAWCLLDFGGGEVPSKKEQDVFFSRPEYKTLTDREKRLIVDRTEEFYEEGNKDFPEQEDCYEK